MKPFLNEDFLLTTDAAKKLYHEYAAKMPVIDYHCHVSPKEIAEDKRYSSVTDVWLGGDHYKWRLIRAGGFPEAEITGAVKDDPLLLFKNFAAVLPKAIGNPVYHWTYLELKRYFGIEKQLTPATAEEIYNAANEKLSEPGMSVRGLIKQSNVKVICTTDDPIDGLEYHARIAADESFDVKVLPAFRPDMAVEISAAGFADYVRKLGEVSGAVIDSFKDLCVALSRRVEFFDSMGCRVADHGFESCDFEDAGEAELNDIFLSAMSGMTVTQSAANKFRTALLKHLAGQYHKYGWVMQLHFGCMRNINGRFYEKLGPNTGFDSMNGQGNPRGLAMLFNELDKAEKLPRTVLYSLNPTESEIIASIMGSFMADAGCAGKIQLGAPWWFNDTKSGMEKQLLDYANASLLGNFIGMLTDSRSFLSYTRHEYFRRILCNFLGELMENGEYPYDFETVGAIVQDISYNNTVKFFGFEV